MSLIVLAQMEMIALLVVAGFVLMIAVMVIALFNGLVRTRNACDESWADIDTELRRRYDLIPNLVETVKGYAAHEKETLDRVIKARNVAMASTGSPASRSTRWAWSPRAWTSSTPRPGASACGWTCASRRGSC